jgi:cell division protein FtsW (lipid II flippase)
MTMLPIASNMPSAMFTPFVVLIAVYLLLSLMGTRARGKDDRAGADRWANLAFAVVLLAALYAIVLVVATYISYPSRMNDMVIILIVIGVFFALLLSAFFVLAELLPGVLRRGRDR